MPGNFLTLLFKYKNEMLKLSNFSQISAISIIAIPAEIYSFGWQYCLVIPMLIPITISINYLFLPVFYHNNIDNCYAVSNYFFLFLAKKTLTRTSATHQILRVKKYNLCLFLSYFAHPVIKQSSHLILIL